MYLLYRNSPLIIIFLCGLLAGASHLSFEALGPLIVPALSIFVWMVCRAHTSGKSIFCKTFLFGLGYFGLSLYWVSSAVLVDADLFGWLVPLTSLGIPAILALPFAVLSTVIRWPRFKGPTCLMGFMGTWMLGEYVRSFMLTGFPWPLLGYITLPYLEIAQLASLGSVYSLSFVVLLVATLPYAVSVLSRNTGIIYIILVIGGLSLIHMWGAGQMTPVTLSSTTIKIVQPNIPQSLKWDPALDMMHLRRLRLMSRENPGDAPPDVLIFPESSLPHPLTPDFARYITRDLSPQTTLITGAMIEDKDAIFNSIVFLNNEGQSLGRYDKHHLVPFGEYIPLRSYIESISAVPLKKITHGMLDFKAGPGPQVLDIKGIPLVAPALCYEIVFPGHILPQGKRADWILNLTNDAWFGDTAGPVQHLAMAQMRAIEERLPVVRAANTGISAVIDGRGRILTSLPYGVQGTLQTKIPLEV